MLSTGLHGKYKNVCSQLGRLGLTNASSVGDVINQWRKELDLDEVAMFEGPYLAEILRIPFTYCWSPALVPKPSDLPSYIGQSHPE
jgi:hypothetical protein